MASIDDLVTGQRLVLQALYSIQQAILSTFPRITGSFTLAAASSTTVADKSISASSIVLPFPKNAAAATLMSGAKSLYHDVSANVAGASFTVKTADGSAAAATEQFSYIVVNPS